MNNPENNIEMGAEKLPTKDEIFELLGVNPTEYREKSDQTGLHRLDFTLEDGTEYDYMRTGEFEGSHSSEQTYICETTPTTWPKKIWLYENGAWKNIR